MVQRKEFLMASDSDVQWENCSADDRSGCWWVQCLVVLWAQAKATQGGKVVVLKRELLMVLSTEIVRDQKMAATRVRRWVAWMVHLTEKNLALPMVDQKEKGMELRKGNWSALVMDWNWVDEKARVKEYEKARKLAILMAQRWALKSGQEWADLRAPHLVVSWEWNSPWG